MINVCMVTCSKRFHIMKDHERQQSLGILLSLKQQEAETAFQDGSLRELELVESCIDAPVPVCNKWKERTFFLFRSLFCKSPIISTTFFVYSRWLITLDCSNCFNILLKPEVFDKGCSYRESETCNYWLSLTKCPQGQPLEPCGL